MRAAGAGGQDLGVARLTSPLWICPKCGARLVTRNLWHSCGRFTLDALFAKAEPDVVALARKYIDMLQALGDVQVIPEDPARLRRERPFRWPVSAQARLPGGVRASALGKSPRIVKTVDYGPKWRVHFVDVRSAHDLDDQLEGWLQESHDTVGLQGDT
jgi:hypothetical protein